MSTDFMIARLRCPSACSWQPGVNRLWAPYTERALVFWTCFEHLKLFAKGACCEGKVSFLPRSDTECVAHSVGHVPCSRVVSQPKTDAVTFVFAFLFKSVFVWYFFCSCFCYLEREREHGARFGRKWGRSWERKNIVKSIIWKSIFFAQLS